MNTTIRTYLGSGTSNTIHGLVIDDWTNWGGTLGNHYFPIYVGATYGQPVGKVSSYFNSPIAIGGDGDTVFPKTNLSVRGLPVHADNAAATTAGLNAGDFYRKADGTVMVRF
jgi:hypothetical protein